jgi:hypothetical protein
VVVDSGLRSGELILKKSGGILIFWVHIIIVFLILVGVFVLVVHRVRAKSICLLSEIGQTRQIRGSQLGPSRLWGFG